ncbi:DUF2920 family protein [Clostridium frigoris]|uniref:DUF2920 family protein n=1 Tax=Clostridium frigoris TaxID=205327 RepID=A0ABS6BT43_9CLOT|nr:DUF2920 family protein [Clostridium frigoris]MBU3160081.1 DUF2920 family protein [Clostridium frigoris]
MAKNYGVVCYGHNSIYVDNYLQNNYKKRKFHVKYSIPNEGVNESTGILLLIAGYGAQCNSNVYKKMRAEFADKYNLVTIQCDYFGYEYMQAGLENLTVENIDLIRLNISTTNEKAKRIYSNNNININEFLNSNLKYRNEIIVKSNSHESIDNFNDMGVMQALDNIVATIKVIKYLKRKKLNFNTNKIIIMGNSHGSYLGYLCNVMAKGLYTHLLDNSAWIYPVYCNTPRYIVTTRGNSVLVVKHDYKIRTARSPLKGLRIKNLYDNFENKCKIVIYHGENDNLITAKDKYVAVKDIPNVVFNLIKKEDIDNVIFKSTSHGLDADFPKLFEKFYKSHCNNIFLNNKLNIDSTIRIPGGFLIDYSSGLPQLIKDSK